MKVLNTLARDGSEPLFDPEGVFWRVNREAFLLIGGGTALLLQVAHPLVAAGVAEHSEFREQPVRRLYGTVRAMRRIIYGDRATALAAAQQVRRVHARVKGELQEATRAFPVGTAYRANDPKLLLWVHATLVWTALRTYETFLPPLSVAERERYHEESKTVGTVLGLAHEQLPTDYAAFQRYFDGMVQGGELEVTPTGAALARDIIHPPISWFPRVAGDVLATATAALLPEPVRELYGLRWSPRRQWVSHFARRSLRRALPYLPDVLRAGRHARRGERRAIEALKA
jgi:uncharacterized protein (DUF2236 family)